MSPVIPVPLMRPTSSSEPRQQGLGRLLQPLLSLMLVVALGLGLGGCVTTGLPLASNSPWQAVPLATRSNPLDLAFKIGRAHV